MNVLVTGGLGVNGFWVTRLLAELGHRAVVVENRTDPLEAEMGQGASLVYGDVLDVAGLIRTITEHRIEVIAHLAALMPDAAQEDPQRGFAVNAIGTVNVLEAARSTGVARVVLTSSKGALAPCLGAYGHPTYTPVDESYPARPSDPTTVYGAAKVASELMGNAYSDLFGFEFVALRFATIYGPGKGVRHGALAVYGQMIENAVNGVRTVIAQGGEEKNDVIYVKDAARAVVAACVAPEMSERLFHVGSGVGVTYTEFGDAIRAFCPGAEFSIGPGLRRSRGTACIMDVSRAGRVLGWSPAFGLAEGIEDYIETLVRMRALEREPDRPSNSPALP